MSLENFFWGLDGYEGLRRAAKEGQDFVRDVAAVMRERVEAEANYAKCLSKLSSRITKATRLAMGSTQLAWLGIAEAMESEADLHRQLSNGLGEDVAKPMKALADHQHKQRKLLNNAVGKVSKSLDDRRSNEAKAKRLSHACARDSESLQEQLLVALRSLETKSNRLNKVPTVRDVQKLESKKERAEMSMRAADTGYCEASARAERCRQELESTARDASGALGRLEEERLAGLHDLAQKYANHLRAFGPSLQQSCGRVSTSVNAIDVSSDLETLVDSRGTAGPRVSEQVLPDFYAENSFNAMKRDRRREAIEKLLKIVERDLELERRGFESLGSPSWLADTRRDKLQHMRAMLVYYEATRYKLQCSLAETEGNTKPSHPLSVHIEVRNKQGMQETVVKLPRSERARED